MRVQSKLEILNQKQITINQQLTTNDINNIKMKKLLFLALVLSSGLALAQDSAKAKALLDVVYNKVKGYDNIQVDFKYSLSNAETDTHQDTRGDVTMEGEKYLLNYLGAKVMYDGKKVYI